MGVGYLIIWMVRKISRNLSQTGGVRGIIRERGDGPLGREDIGRGLCGLTPASLQIDQRAMILKFVLLAPIGALIVLVVYYSIYVCRPLFEISSISINIFSFSF